MTLTKTKALVLTSSTAVLAKMAAVARKICGKKVRHKLHLKQLDTPAEVSSSSYETYEDLGHP